MNKLKKFEFENKRVRTTNVNGEPYFCLADICKILGLANPTRVSKRLDSTGLTLVKVYDINGLGIRVETNMNYINESNLYRCLLRSDKKEAIRLQDWITKEVLPSIRKEGAYGLTDRDIVRKAMNILNDKVEFLEKKVEQAQPKVDFYDQVTGSDEVLVNMEQVAKIPNMGVGRNTLFQILRNNNILMNDNIPYQKFIERGYFRVIQKKYEKQGKVLTYVKTMVYQKGLDYIRRFLIRMGARRKMVPLRRSNEKYLFNKYKG